METTRRITAAGQRGPNRTETSAKSEWKYGAALQTWLRAEIEGGKKKSVRLYHGVVGLRTKPAGVHVTDPAAALSWARENVPGAVTEGLDKKALADALLANGESVPFAEYQAAEDVFYIK